MESASRNGAVVPQDTAPEVGTVEIATAATALRWSRPDLTAALAEHLMEVAAAVSDRDGWLVAAGWRVHAVGATGDARDVAADVLEALPGWGADALSGCASERLRLELAVLAHDAGEHDISGALLDGVSRDGRDDADVALAAEAATAHLRCRRDEGSGDPAAALAAWDRLGGAAGDTGAATVLLVAAATDRRIGRAGSAVTRAVDGLGRLDRARTSPRALSPSPHLAAALAAEWISALIGAGRPDQSREGSRPLRERLVEYARPTRQLALLRLTLARVAAEDAPDGGDAAKELERAAHDAAASDAPELEYICRTALGEVHEAGGRMEQALESLRLAAVAERRHRSRAARFRAAVAAVPGLLAGATRTGGPSTTARGPAASPVPVATGEPGSARRPSGAAVEPPGRAAAVEPVPPPDGPGPAAAVGRTAPGSIERTTVLRPVRQSSTAAQKPGDGSPRRGPVVSGAGPDGEQAGPTGTSRPLSNGSASGAHGRSGTNGTAVPGTGRSGANPAGPWADRAHRNAPFHPDPSATGPNEGNGQPPRRPEAGAGGVDGRPGSNGSGSNGSGLNGSGSNGSAVRASGRYPHGAESGPVLPVDETDPPVTAPMNPWATGVWTAGPLLAPADRPGGASALGSTDVPVAGAPPADMPPAGAPVGEVSAPGSLLADGLASGVPASGVPAALVPASGAPAPDVAATPPDPVASALADPEAWLASALADLDRIWGRRPGGADDTSGDDTSRHDASRDEAGPPEATEVAPAGCVIVVDLARGGERLPAAEVASTVRRVARRLARKLPESAHLLRDRPDAVSVVLADGDRAAAAEWMHQVVPALVDGLAVDAAVDGAHLRAAVHDAQGVVGAQVLQRLEGGRVRPRGGTPGRARHAAPGDLPTAGPEAANGEGPDGAGPGPVPTPGGAGFDGRVTADGAGPAAHGAGPAADGADPAAGATGGTTRAGASGGANEGRANEGVVTDGRVPSDRMPSGGVPGGSVPGGSVPSGGSPGGGVTGDGVTGDGVIGDGVIGGGVTGGGIGGNAAPAPGRSAGGDEITGGEKPDTAAGPTGGPPRIAAPLVAGPERYDDTGGRRPYLPDGVIVRPGTGGRRHRRGPDPTPDEPEPAAPPAGAPARQQSTEGLGLADLLAGALAAYRGI